MNKIIPLVLIVPSAMAAYAPIDDRVPIELSHITREVQSSPYYSASKDEVNSLIKELDQSLTNLRPEEVNFLAKAEILKALITSPPVASYSLKLLFPDPSKKLDTLAQEITSPFLSWFILGLSIDFRELASSQSWPYLIRQGDKSLEEVSANIDLPTKKKLALILPWYNYVLTARVDSLEAEIFTLLMQCLRDIKFITTSYANFTPPHQDSPYFKTVSTEQLKNVPSPTPSSSLNSILDEVIKKHRKAKLPLPVDDWNRAADLPEPVDDWTRAIDLPEPVDDWTRAIDLPEPVDDWTKADNLPEPVL